MELSPAQCATLAQIVPVLLLAVIVERRIFASGSSRGVWSFIFTMAASVAATILLTIGVDEGLDDATALIVIGGAFLYLVLDLVHAVDIDIKRLNRDNDAG